MVLADTVVRNAKLSPKAAKLAKEKAISLYYAC